MDPPEILAEISSSFQQKREMLQILIQDCKELYEAIQINNDNQMARRTYVRAVFALIEGVLHRTKATTAHLGKLLGSLSIPELDELDDRQLEVNDKGDFTYKPLFLTLLNNIKLTFKAYSKSIGSPFNLNLSGMGWQKLCKAVKVRDRLMHPKEIIDLHVNDTEIAVTKNTLEWFLFSYNLSGYYAQKTIQAKTSASIEDVAALDATIHRLEAELAVRNN